MDIENDFKRRLKRHRKQTVAVASMGGVMRHLGGALGAYIATTGYVDADQAQQISGALTTIAMVGWSILQKYRTAD